MVNLLIHELRHVHAGMPIPVINDAGGSDHQSVPETGTKAGDRGWEESDNKETAETMARKDKAEFDAKLKARQASADQAKASNDGGGSAAPSEAPSQQPAMEK